MKDSEISKIMDWVRTTDLVEVSFKEKDRGFSLQTAQAAPNTARFLSGLQPIPVAAPCVGLFQWNQPGQPKTAEEGASVTEGAILGLIDTGLKKTVPVKSPASGLLTRVLIEAGETVGFGQPLFFISPR